MPPDTSDKIYVYAAAALNAVFVSVRMCMQAASERGKLFFIFMTFQSRFLMLYARTHVKRSQIAFESSAWVCAGADPRVLN